MVKDLIYFERSHSLSVGDKGEETFDVSSPSPACGTTGLAFDHARVIYRRQRFGEAIIVSTPAAGCTHCQPLVVRWFHEPTGYLSYQLHIYRRTIAGNCSH